MWQVCPLCKGKGYRDIQINSQDAMHLCRVCDGKFIINELTGHPPAQKPQVSLEEQRNKESVLKGLREFSAQKSNDFYKDLTGTNDPLKNVNFL